MKKIIFILLNFLISFNVSFSAKLSPSLLLFHEWDLDDCQQRVEKILTFSPKDVQILLSFQFIANEENELTSYCFNNNQSQCEKITNSLIERVQGKLLRCLKEFPPTTKMSFNIHLNDSSKKGLWRNRLIFDPLQSFDGVSFYTSIIRPSVETLKKLQLIYPINFSLQGEMGATIFSYPKSYIKIISKLKSIYPRDNFGISLNYNEISGLSIFSISNMNLIELNKLFFKIDFLGFSAYAPLSIELQEGVFQKYVDDFKFQLLIKGILLSPYTPLQFSEIGLGGGNWLNDGKTPAKNPEEALGAPYAGIFNFAPEANPWKNFNLKDIRRRYYKRLIYFLKTQNSVIRAFQWNAGSWDVHGIYPRTQNFTDPKIIKMLKDH